jgi:hypothetical protein
MRCFVLLALAAVVVNSAPIFMPAPIGDEVLGKLNNDLDNLLETAEDKYYTDKERDQMAKDDKTAPMKNGVVSKQEQAAENGKSKDPYKQMGTYSEEMKKHDELTARRLSKPPKKINGVRKRVSPLDYFDTVADQKKRAQQIATHIFKIIQAPVQRKAAKTALHQSIENIKKKGVKDAKFLRRIYKKSVRRDRKERRQSQTRADRASAEKRKPKLSILHRHIEKMKAEDKHAERTMKRADAETIAEIEKDGLPTAKEAQAQARAEKQRAEAQARAEQSSRDTKKALSVTAHKAADEAAKHSHLASTHPSKTPKKALLDESENLA